MKLKTIISATAMIVAMADAASAATFGFSFSNVEGATTGTVSGVITLGDGDGTFSASSVIVVAAPALLGYTLPEEFVSVAYSDYVVNSFIVTGGVITSASFAAFSPVDGLALSEDSFGGLSLLNVEGSTDPFNGVTDQNSSTLAFVSAVPLPAGLPLFVAGLGSLGILSRRRKAA